jgi:pimeloyl-ACP methyl ester carboxylesterase
MEIQPFKIEVAQETLDDLQQRLKKTRWPDEVKEANWDYGTNLGYLKTLVEYWQNTFDWRQQEASINQFAQYYTTVDGLGIHFIYERAKSSNSMPLLMLHGWPSTFYQMVKIIPMLTNPASYGNDSALSFDVIVPSLPGYGFSEQPKKRGMGLSEIAELMHKLMTTKLGYQRYATRSGDLGAGVTQQMVLMYPEAIIGNHTSGTNPYVGEVPDNLTEAEQKFVENVERWQQEEMAYALLHSTKPQTLAYGLNDSPVGLAAWIIEKFRRWSDCNGDVETRFTKDELLTNVMIYWVTQTINSSIRLYYEVAHTQANWGWVDVPTAIIMPSKDMFPTPREWLERSSRLDRWIETERGGHFLEMEEPEMVADDLRKFFTTLR